MCKNFATPKSKQFQCNGGVHFNPIKPGPFLGGDELGVGGWGGGTVWYPSWYLSYERSKLQNSNLPRRKCPMLQSELLLSPLSCIVSSGAASRLPRIRSVTIVRGSLKIANFLSYRHVIYIKKFLRPYRLQIWKKNVHCLAKKIILDRFWKKIVILVEKSKNHKKWLYQCKVGMLIIKVKKFGVVWDIPFEMTAKSAPGLIGLKQ